ncbi:MAG: histone deacetylase family protein [Nitriliruptoraceae bacterium]
MDAPDRLTAATDLVVVSDDAHRHHDPPFELNAGQQVWPVPDRPARLDAIAAAVRAAGLTEQAALPHDDAVLTAVHDPGMLTFLRDGHAEWVAAGGPEVLIPDTFRSPRWNRGGRPTASPLGRAGWYVTDTATPIVAGSWRAARAGADVACTAVDAVLAGHRAAYAMTRPPGHHAGPDYLGGFCLLNLAAIAAAQLRPHGRVAIVDVDVHHGNGTQDVFWTDPEVLYVSVHTDPDHQYPYLSGTAAELGEGPGQGTTRNLPLAPGTTDAGVLHAVEVACELVTAFDPTAVVVSLGLDTAASDPLGRLALSPEGFAPLGRLLAALDRPTVLVQEGGYALEVIGRVAVDVLTAFRAPPARP